MGIVVPRLRATMGLFIRLASHKFRFVIVAAIALSGILVVCPRPAAAQAWQLETVDKREGEDVGYFSALVVDREGNVHIGYWDSTDNELLYAFRNRGVKEWSRMTVDKDGEYVSLAVDRASRPYFAYNSPSSTGLHYAHWDGKKWIKRILDFTKTAYNTSIQLDPKGLPGISYYVEYPTSDLIGRLKYAHFDGTTWFVQTVDRRQFAGKMNSLAFDSHGNPQISYSYLLGTENDLLYVGWNGSIWQRSDADLQANEGKYFPLGNSLALDSSGNPHIANLDAAKFALQYISRNRNRWTVEVVDQLGGVEVHDHVSLQIDKDDQPHIAYRDGGALKYAVRGKNGWHIEVVDRGDVGFRPSLYLDDEDHAYISYYDVANHALRLAHEVSNGK